MSNEAQGGETIRVVVVGAGYAGMIFTNRFLGSLNIDEKRRVELTVVNPRGDFVERIRLHELAAGTRDSVTRPLRAVLHPDADLVVGRADRIDPDARLVTVRSGARVVELSYNHLLYAVGSVAAAPIPGAREHAFLLGDFEGATRASTALRGAIEPRVTVVGGGFTGVEAAAEIAERHPSAHVTLVCADDLVATMRPQARASMRRTLRRLGVTVEENARVTEIEAGKVLLADGRIDAFDVCIVAASFDVPDLASASGLAVDERGRLRVDATLRSVGDPRIIGAGDAVVAPDEAASHLRMACAVALPLGGHAAETLLAVIREAEPAPLSIGFVLQCISLGRRRGYVQLVRPDDSPRPFRIRGWAGARIKEMICRMVLDSPVKEIEKPGSYSWPAGPKRKVNT